MSDDPETARQIAELLRSTRPLLVLDVDDVVLEFLPPFMRYLNSLGLELKLESFRLHGNIRELDGGAEVPAERVSTLIADFFDLQADWQQPAAGVADAVADISRHAEIVMLTAMPHRHRDIRRRHLDALGFNYPLLTTERAKGPALKLLRGDHPRPIAFVDDMPHNLTSVLGAVPDAGLFHLIVTPGLRALLPPTADPIVPVDSWAELTPHLARALKL